MSDQTIMVLILAMIKVLHKKTSSRGMVRVKMKKSRLATGGEDEDDDDKGNAGDPRNEVNVFNIIPSSNVILHEFSLAVPYINFPTMSWICPSQRIQILSFRLSVQNTSVC